MLLGSQSMKEPVEWRSRACSNNFCLSKAPSCAFPGFTDADERAEQPRELPPGPSVPKGLCVPSPLPQTTMRPRQAWWPHFSGCGAAWMGCLQFYCQFCHPPFVIWNDFYGYLLCLLLFVSSACTARSLGQGVICRCLGYTQHVGDTGAAITKSFSS